ncbi:[protein-PII] uridylyltransferase [Rhodococcus sp. D2-41]|uniref:Bifunctional uridylyltransferase/uridylyl-removing enzyme n=1 Tax=Speluncibacter jeojiensis TaxID=2710754 RepID=A0A9X4M0E6_9ACTN|nr:[protein-PII] uridylyltransferase [Rhodococcus sp. D2-41]MDG3011017.1 [protein-PII] uridylyltransferase [Rhodococcus sp. D2-41]MDG3013992.1 [protein-PII] uridylyltransferase [Corynebacteriales bacterium D3-21]
MCPEQVPGSTGRSSGRRRSSPGSAGDLVRARDRLVADTGEGRRLDAPALREALTDLFEFWLTAKASEVGVTAGSAFAIVAVGGLGRREMMPYSDLDLILVHDRVAGPALAEVADGLWYPLWDAHIKLDHSVRTVDQALEVAAGDLTAALGLLDARHIAGNEELGARLVRGVRRQWREGIRSRFDGLVEQAKGRWDRAGELANRAEPDLKHGRGGLRDVQLLHALAIAHVTDAVPDMRPDSPGAGLELAHTRLLDVRTELHRVAGRAREQVLAQDADEIAAALRIGDRFELARLLSDCGRTVAYAVDVGLRTASNSLPRSGLGRLRTLPVRRPLDEGVVEHAGEVVLARDARPDRDPGLILRVAAAAAQTGLPMSASTLSRLADSAPELRGPWPREALDDLLVLLGAGRGAVAAIEALDRTGLWGRLFPEWGVVRDLPPRDAVHTWTVDRHLVETVAHAATLTTRVARPDLLLLGALLHDIGKGRGVDHSVIGAELAAAIGTRIGLWPADVTLLGGVVRHHLLLPVTATRRNLDNPAVVQGVVDAIGADAQLLELLQALAEADSLATGPGVWGEWKSALIGELVRRCRLVLRGEDLPHPDPVDPQHLELASSGGVHVTLGAGDGVHSRVVTVIAPDQPGLLSKAAGVLALHALQVHSASLRSHGGAVINEFVVSPRFGSPPDRGLLRQDLIRALSGSLDLPTELARKERDQPRVGGGGSLAARTARARVLWFETGAPDEVIVEVRALDAWGLLSRIAGALESCGADVRWAKVSTLGSSVVDAFCLELGRPADPATRADVERAILTVSAPPGDGGASA